MKIRFPYIFIPLLSVIFACADDPVVTEPESFELDLNSYHISFKLKGVKKTKYPGVHVSEYVTQSGSIDTSGDPEEEGVVEIGGGYKSASEFMEISNRFTYNKGEYATDYDAAITNTFNNGSYSFKYGDDGLGIELEYLSANFGVLTTKTGDQTGSNFAISEIVSIGETVAHDVTIKGTFNCQLYNDDMSSYSITAGTFYVRMEL